MKPRLVVLDDEPHLVEVVGMLFRRDGYDVRSFVSPRECLASLERDPADLLITDLRMAEADGLSVLRAARAIDPELPVVVLTAYGSVASAVEAMREGAFDYVQKPFDNDDLLAVVRRGLRLSALSRENRFLRAQLASTEAPLGMVAESAAMRDVLDRVRRAARSRSTVLLTGESGTGKELVARAVHYYSPRVDGPFVAVNCGALPDTLIEAELFGHERGAFTGAVSARAGLFERAEGGTLFLDEIGELGAEVQSVLLRVLQEREVVRVGGNASKRVDVRIVAATNRDLAAEVRHGRFREDLYFRLAVIPIHVSPLRERPEDIGALVTLVLERTSRELGRPTPALGDGVLDALRRRAWPGNVRELENLVERAVVLSRGPAIGIDDVGVGDERDRQDSPAPTRLDAHLDRVTADHIATVLEATGGRRIEAARRLGIDRTTLYRLMKRYGL
jgi:DNA-binding NtrC family response regulator